MQREHLTLYLRWEVPIAKFYSWTPVRKLARKLHLDFGTRTFQNLGEQVKEHAYGGAGQIAHSSRQRHDEEASWRRDADIRLPEVPGRTSIVAAVVQGHLSSNLKRVTGPRHVPGPHRIRQGVILRGGVLGAVSLAWKERWYA